MKEEKEPNFVTRITERMRKKKPEPKLGDWKEETPEQIVKPKEIVPETKPTRITAQLKDLKESMDKFTQETQTKKNLKKKQFKMPYKVKSQLKKLAMKGKVQVILLQNNRNIKPTIGEIKDGMLLVGDKIHDGAANYVWLWNGKVPTVILPEWSINPLSPARLMGDATEEGRLSDPQAIILRAIEFSESLQPKKMSSRMMIFAVVAIVIVGYVLFAGS